MSEKPVYHRFKQEYALIIKVNSVYPEGVRHKYQAVDLAKRCRGYGFAELDFQELPYVSSYFVKELKKAFDKHAPRTVVSFENLNWTKYDKKLMEVKYDD